MWVHPPTCEPNSGSCNPVIGEDHFLTRQKVRRPREIARRGFLLGNLRMNFSDEMADDGTADFAPFDDFIQVWVHSAT